MQSGIYSSMSENNESFISHNKIWLQRTFFAVPDSSLYLCFTVHEIRSIWKVTLTQTTRTETSHSSIADHTNWNITLTHCRPHELNRHTHTHVTRTETPHSPCMSHELKGHTHPLQATRTEEKRVGDGSGGASGLLTRRCPSLYVHGSCVRGSGQRDDQLTLSAWRHLHWGKRTLKASELIQNFSYKLQICLNF